MEVLRGAPVCMFLCEKNGWNWWKTGGPGDLRSVWTFGLNAKIEAPCNRNRKRDSIHSDRDVDIGKDRCLNWTNGDRLTILRFADDVVLFSESPQKLQLMVEELRTASNKVGLEINLSMTKVMFNRNVKIQPVMTGNMSTLRLSPYETAKFVSAHASDVEIKEENVEKLSELIFTSYLQNEYSIKS
ncbi:putative uncharacterized transposon-derived protein F52C9.6 [Nymphon striatum]|nr:putative uncharacterized transposon-derived protein F52C9.6 [Nymphon striatum]